MPEWAMKIKKSKFIAYIYIPFNRSLDEKSYIIAKIEAVKNYMQFFF